MSGPSCWLHGTALVVGEAGILILGRSGSGKSALTLALIDDARRDGVFARLVGDDRLLAAPANGRLVLRPHPRIAGLVERRGVGIVPVAYEPACVARLVVRLSPTATEARDRVPEAPPTVSLCGLEIPALRLRSEDGARDNGDRVRAALRKASTPMPSICLPIWPQCTR